MINDIITLRKELHQNPELSGREVQTANRIKSFFAVHHPTEIIENFGGKGLAIIFEFSKKGPTVALRCELDALPIDEENQFSHRSNIKGVSHKCGHDGHMAILASLAHWLKKQRFQTGKVVLLFQAAEETGQGALQMIADERFCPLQIDYIFALHNIPGEPMHHIIVPAYGFSAEVQSFSITLTGKECHAAEPENGINPATCIAEIVSSLSKLNRHELQNPDFASLTPVYLNMGQKAYGLSPGHGEIHYTIRTWSSEKMEALKLAITQLVESIVHANALKWHMEWFEHFPSSKNEEACNAILKKAATLNDLRVQERPYPFTFGEDFGWFSKDHNTSMFGLGAGVATPALHHANYDFPDELIETGSNLFKTIITLILNP
jgi:amidohydrolase